MADSLRNASRFLRAEGCLDLLWASWDGCPISAPVRASLDSMSAALPAIPRVGLELRLGMGETRVDLHQLVTRADGEPALLVEQFTTGRLRAFLQAWSENRSGFGDVFPQLYIEYDLVEDGEAGHTPCLFFDVHRRLENRGEKAAREALIVEAIEQLYGGIAPCTRTALERCFAAVQGRGSIGHLGVMLGRDEQPIRLNIKDLRRGALPPLLDELGWAGNHQAAEKVFNQLLDEADLVTVALDLFDEWLPVIGFEGFIGARAGADCRWQLLLSRLCDEGLCTLEERRSLLQFPGTLMPSLSGPRWPASWLVAATFAPPDRLPSFRRELSHLKISLDDAGKPSAKVYLGMHHEWRVPPIAVEACAERPARVLNTSLPACIAAAVEAAQDFLLRNVSQGDFWHDFRLDIGTSDEWVTAFVAGQMALTGLPRGLIAADNALRWLLRRQRPAGGWGYNATAPPDADSTAWVLRLAAARGVQTEAVHRARAFLAGHLLSDGGVTTYRASTPIRFGDRNLAESEAAGWRDAHACVAANAASFLGRRALDGLRRSQTPGGAWRAYWWQSDMFATALAAESLLTDPYPGDLSRVERAIAWAVAQDPDRDAPAFDIAWRLRLERLGRSGITKPGIELRVMRLLELQEADGGWPAGAPMLFPEPSAIERMEGAPRFIDQERNFTTAAVQAALAMAALELARERQVHQNDRPIPLCTAATL